MKKNRLIPLIAVGMLASSANAVIKSNWSTAQSDGKKPTVGYEEVDSGKVTELESGQRIECNDGNNIPLGLLKTIMPNFDQIKVDFETKNKKSARIEIPQYMKSCMKLKFSYHQVGNDIFISATNEEDLTSYEGNNTNERYENCLKAKGIVHDDIIDESKAEFSGGFTQPFSVKLDPSQNMNVHFSSPQALGTSYGPAAGGEFLDYSHSDCFKGEEIVPGGLKLFHSPLVASVEHYQAICESDNYKDIFAALKELSSSDAGNAQALDSDVKNILRAALDEKLFNSIKEKQKVWEEELEEIGKELKKAEDEETVKELTAKYNSVLKELEKFVIKPKTAQLQKLYEERKKTKDKKARRELDKKIKELNEEIGIYSRKSNFVSNPVINKMLEYGLKDEADEAFKFKLTCAHWSQVNYGPKREGYPKDPKGIDKAVESKMRAFERVSTDKEKEYDAKQGYDTYSKDYANIAQQLVNKRALALQRDQDRMQDAYKNIQKYCASTFWGGIKNKSKCQSAQKSYQTAASGAQKRYGRYNKDIMYYTNQANKFYQIESQYTESLRTETSDPYGADSYDGYDDFSLFLGQNYGSSSIGNDFNNFAQFGMTGSAGMMAMPGAQVFGQNGQVQYMQNPYSPMYGQQQMPMMSSPVPMVGSPLNSGGNVGFQPYSNTPTYTMPTGR